MGFACGIVGLPNVGKSTLFNALTATALAETANYPFCTIEPNSGRVNVPDPRLDAIARIVEPKAVVPAQLEFVDIAGLVAGASQGEGLGNKFLAHIREVDAVVHVVRCFEGGGVSHVAGAVDPLSDIATVETELMLADLESLERRREPLVKKARGQDREAKEAAAGLKLMDAALEALTAGKPARSIAADAKALARLQLLTSKPVLYVCNVDEGDAATGNAMTETVAAHASAEGAGVLVVSAKIEAEVAQLTDAAERRDYLAAMGLEESGLARLIRAGYALLGLITFFTAGPKEVRAWTIPAGTRAQDAAGTIHTDFARGFIAAETIAYDQFLALGGEAAAKEAGKMRAEGRDYIVKDGDVILFRFNV